MRSGKRVNRWVIGEVLGAGAGTEAFESAAVLIETVVVVVADVPEYGKGVGMMGDVFKAPDGSRVEGNWVNDIVEDGKDVAGSIEGWWAFVIAYDRS